MTHPSLRTVNVRPLFELDARPVLIGLDNSALTGFIEVNVDIRQNLGEVDFWNLVVRTTSLTENNSIIAFVITTSETEFVIVTNASLNARISQQKLVFRF